MKPGSHYHLRESLHHMEEGDCALWYWFRSINQVISREGIKLGATFRVVRPSLAAKICYIVRVA